MLCQFRNGNFLELMEQKFVQTGYLLSICPIISVKSLGFMLKVAIKLMNMLVSNDFSG